MLSQLGFFTIPFDLVDIQYVLYIELDKDMNLVFRALTGPRGRASIVRKEGKVIVGIVR